MAASFGDAVASNAADADGANPSSFGDAVASNAADADGANPSSSGIGGKDADGAGHISSGTGEPDAEAIKTAAVSGGTTNGDEAYGGLLHKAGGYGAQRYADEDRHEAIGAYMTPLTPCLSLEAPAAQCTLVGGESAAASHWPPGLEHPPRPREHGALGRPRLASEEPLPSPRSRCPSATPRSVHSLLPHAAPETSTAGQPDTLACLGGPRRRQARRALHRLKCSCGTVLVAGSVAKKSVDCSVCSVVAPHGRQAYSCASCGRRICKTCHRTGRNDGSGETALGLRAGGGLPMARTAGSLTGPLMQQTSEGTATHTLLGHIATKGGGMAGYIPGFVHDCMQASHRVSMPTQHPCPPASGGRAGIGSAMHGRTDGEVQDPASDLDGKGSGDEDVEGLGPGGNADRMWQRSLQALVWDPVATHELQGLPLVYAKAPLLWIPRALRERVCAILCGLLQDAVQPRDAELANLLLFHSGQLLLRIPRQESDGGAGDAPTACAPARESTGRGEASAGGGESIKMQGIVAQVRERIALAEKGAWGQLVHALYTETQEAAGRGRSMQREDVAGPNALALVDAPAGELAWDTKALARAAHKGRIGSPKASANILCGQAAVAASPETTRCLQKLISAPIPYGEHEAMQKQRDRGRRLREERPLVVENKQVIAGALNLHAAASPGPGGFRNSYIQAIAECPGGAEALRRWCNMVDGGNMPAASSRLWNAAMLRPFFKGDGVSIRPVICGEALFKFAMAVCFAACNKQ